MVTRIQEKWLTSSDRHEILIFQNLAHKELWNNACLHIHTDRSIRDILSFAVINGHLVMKPISK